MRPTSATYVLCVAIGLVAGIAAGLLGIGGGVIMVPIIHLLFGRTMQVAVGTSAAVIVVSSIAAVARHIGFGNVDWAIAAGLGIGSVAGAYLLGAPMAEVVPSDLLRRIFGVVMCLFGLQMVGFFQWLARLVK
ncbi:MAG: sulfite exporter TauE/SafE family protein [Armatimonadetes bacterium]|nr:sulfite exporter TauE/SafE family protein [Armatimonadota bacterium]